MLVGMHQDKLHPKALIALALAILTWASAFVGIRAGLSDFHPGAMALLRYLVASLVMLGFYLAHKDHKPVSKKEAGLMALLGLLGFTAYNIFLNTGEQSVTAGISSFVVSLAPVMIMLLAIGFLKEHVRPIQWLGVAVSVVGVGIICLGEYEQAQINWGVFLLLLAAFSAAAYNVLQKPLFKKFKPITVTTYAVWAGTVFLLGYAPQLALDLQSAHWKAIVWVLYLGVFPGAIGYWCFAYVLSQMPASRASTLLYMLPLTATFMGWLILGETPTLVSLVGALIAWAGSVLAQTKPKAQPKPL